MEDEPLEFDETEPIIPLGEGEDFGNIPIHGVPGMLAVSAEVVKPGEEPVPDEDKVAKAAEEFMEDLYDTERYRDHNERLLKYHPKYSGARRDTSEKAGVEETGLVAELPADSIVEALLWHDMVDHVMLHPEKTAARLKKLEFDAARTPSDIKNDGFALLIGLLEGPDGVEDPDALIKAFLYDVDASEWESAARSWRDGAKTRVAEKLLAGEISAENSRLILAAINKEPVLDELEPDELKALEEVLKMPEHFLSDLKLDVISRVTLDHNFEGVFIKGLETLDLIENPPPNNPASTYRDVTEAINFFVPALMGLGYKQLAIDLRGAALKWSFPDPNGDAERQHELSEEYFEEVREPVIGLLEKEFAGIGADIEARVKSEGSLRQKLASEGYLEARMTPDGIGFAFKVPDNMAGDELTQFAEAYRKRLIGNPNIRPGHPAGSETFEKKERDNGYEAVHMTFYYYPDPETSPDHKIPFEIQALTQTQHRMKLYGRWSDLFYKAGIPYMEEAQRHLDHMEKRADAKDELSSSSTIRSLATMIALSQEMPQKMEIPSIYSKLFRVVEGPHGNSMIVPRELEEVIEAQDIPGTPGELTVLPANFVNRKGFTEAISMFGRELATDRNIQNALDLVQAAEKGNTRNNGVTPVFEGHLLPTALAAVMLAVQSGEILEGELGPLEEISTIATVALLHDEVENELERIDSEDEDLRMITRHHRLTEIKHKFGLTVMESVDALTIPFEIEDETQRREQYTKNIQANRYARLVKPADRMQNHLSDLLSAASLTPPALSEKQLKYFAKTDRHLSEFFASSELPDAYRRVHAAVWNLAGRFGY